MIDRLKGLLKRRKFVLFTRPYELNIVGLRNKNMKAYDEIHVFYKINDRNWNYHVFGAITDTAFVWKDKAPILLKEGQYIDAYSTGEYTFPDGNQKTEALIEAKLVSVITDFDRKAFIPNGKVRSELAGINIIPPFYQGKELTIDEKDEGSQVFVSEENFAVFMLLCSKHKELYGNQFTYSLIDFRSAKKKLIQRGLEIVTTLITTFFFGFLAEKIKQGKKTKK